MGIKNIGTGAIMTGEEQAPIVLSDAKASAQLKVLHNNYKVLAKKRPKSPAEAVTLPLIFEGRVEELAAIDAEYMTKTTAWRDNMNVLLHSMFDLGKSNPSGPISIFDEKSGRRVQKNGKTLAEALLREESVALRGTAE